MDLHWLGWDDDDCAACRDDRHVDCDPLSQFCSCSRGECGVRLYVLRLADRHNLPRQTFRRPRGPR